MELDKIKILEKLYHDPSSPAGFAGQKQLYSEAIKIDPTITGKDVKHFLEGDRTYTLHRPRRVRFQRAKTIPSGIYTDIQADLAQMDKFARYNNGHKYILVAVCVLSKRLWAFPLKSKQYGDVSKGFDLLLADIPIKPWVIFTDRGKEFILNEKKKIKNAHGKTEIKNVNYFDERGIDKYWSSTKTIKAALAERYIRILKARLYRYFSENGTMKWIDVLPKIVDAINHSPSRITGKAAVDVNFKNAQSIWEKVYGPAFHPPQRKQRHKKGEQVRLANYKEVFDRGYLPNWSDEIMEIAAVKKGNVDTYKIKDEADELFKGNFYAEDLGKTRKNEETTYRIEKVYGKRIRNGENQIRVKFFGFPNKQWISSSDIVK
jgi:hypothetical protein